MLCVKAGWVTLLVHAYFRHRRTAIRQSFCRGLRAPPPATGVVPGTEGGFGVRMLSPSALKPSGLDIISMANG